MEFKKFKNVALTTTLAGTLALVGCGAQEQKDTTVATSTSATQEQVTEPVKESNIEKDIVVNEQSDYEIENFYNPAATLYNDNVDFFSSEVVGNNMAYYDEKTGEINIDRIENVVKVIKGEVEDLTPSEVVTSRNNIEMMLLPQYLVAKTNFASVEPGFLNENGKQILEAQVPEIAKLSTIATDEETKEYVENYENVINRVIADYNANNSITPETKTILENEIYKLKSSNTTDLNYMNNDSSSIGNKLLLNITKLKMISLYVTVTNEPTLGDYVLAPRNQEEIDALDLYYNEETRDTMTDKDKEIYNNYQSVFLGKEFIDEICSLENELANYAHDNDNVYSENNKEEIIKLLQTKKEALETYKQSYHFAYDYLNKTLC